MKRIILTLVLLAAVVLTAVMSCHHEPKRFPPSLTIENGSAGTIWFTGLTIGDRLIPFGGIGGTYSKTVGFSFVNLQEIQHALLAVRVSTQGEAGTLPWVERSYEPADVVLLNPEIAEKIGEIRFIYYADRPARIRLVDHDRGLLYEVPMRLKEETFSPEQKK